jgi:hypothetical protein
MGKTPSSCQVIFYKNHVLGKHVVVIKRFPQKLLTGIIGKSIGRKNA